MKDRGLLRSAVYLILKRDQEILLLKRFNTGYQDGNYSFIAGHIEHHESPTQAIIREAQEEAGISVKKEDLKFIQILHRRCSDSTVYIDYFFTVENWTGNIQVMEPNKCSSLDWFHLNQLPDNLIPYIRDVIQKWQMHIVFNELSEQTTL